MVPFESDLLSLITANYHSLMAMIGEATPMFVGNLTRFNSIDDN